MEFVGLAVCYVYTAWLASFVLRAVLSFFPLEPGGFVANVRDFCTRVTEPVLRPVRSIIPPVGAGGMGLDLSFMIVTFLLFMFWGPICSGF